MSEPADAHLVSETPSRTRDNHFVPRFQLRRWADNHEVWTYRTLVSSSAVPFWERKQIRGLAVRRDLYTNLTDGAEDDDIERWLNQEVERPANEAITKLEKGQRLNAADWRALIRFFAAQDVRTPVAFSSMMGRWQADMPTLIEKTIKETVAKIADATRRGVSLSPHPEPNEYAHVMRFEVDRSGQDGQSIAEGFVLAGRGLWIASIKRVLSGRAMDKLLSHRWSIAEAPEGAEWPLTDHPVLKLNFVSLDHYDFGGGWGRRGSELMMPLTPRFMMYVQVGRSSGRYVSFRPDQLSMLRRFLVERAHRFVFALQPMDWVQAVKPRTVDPALYASEADAWDKWPVEQTEAERAWQRGEED